MILLTLVHVTKGYRESRFYLDSSKRQFKLSTGDLPRDVFSWNTICIYIPGLVLIVRWFWVLDTCSSMVRCRQRKGRPRKVIHRQKSGKACSLGVIVWKARVGSFTAFNPSDPRGSQCFSCSGSAHGLDIQQGIYDSLSLALSQWSQRSIRWNESVWITWHGIFLQ